MHGPRNATLAWAAGFTSHYRTRQMPPFAEMTLPWMYVFSSASHVMTTPLAIPVAQERRSGQERRDVGERRRQIDPTTCERDYNNEEIEFMKAMDQYKRENRRPFPTWSEVLEVLRALGYQKTGSQSVMPGLCTSMPPKA